MPDFVIHVGPHKTGSTYIQRRLDQNSDLLLAQGIYVPKEWQENKENPSHTGVVHAVRSGQLAHLENEFTNLKSSDHRYVVISSEAFMDCDEETLHQFCGLLGAANYTVVYYVRRWSELVLSSWNEIIAQGHTVCFPDYLARTLANVYSSYEVNIGPRLNMLIRVFGRNSVKLVSYDTVIESGGDIFRHFTRHFLGSPNLLPPTKLRSNISVPTALAELRRILNYLEQEAGLERSARMAILLQKRTDIDLGKMLIYIDGFKRSIVLADNREPIIQILKQARLEPTPRYKVRCQTSAGNVCRHTQRRRGLVA